MGGSTARTSYAVVGPGEKIRVYAAPGGEVVGHSKIWRELDKTPRGAKPVLPPGRVQETVGQALARHPALLLADMARKGEVVLTDPVAKYLPAKSKMPHCRAVSSRAESRDPVPRAVQGIPRLRSE